MKYNISDYENKMTDNYRMLSLTELALESVSYTHLDVYKRQRLKHLNNIYIVRKNSIS